MHPQSNDPLKIINSSPFGDFRVNATNITSKTTTVLKRGGGRLLGISINTLGAGSNTCKVYDGTDATGILLGTIDTTAALNGTMVADFVTGLTVVTATGTQADLTVMWM